MNSNRFTEAGAEMDMTKVKFIHGTSEKKAAEIKRRNDELDKLGQKYDRFALSRQISLRMTSGNLYAI